jgi:deazaflavin-dependent oxidoreductase (nitroreductase family)
MGSFNMQGKPSGFWKWLLHTPTWLYRARLGFVFGKRLVMIEHRGRKSGKLYRTVIEVAGRGTVDGTYIVTSGTGPNADWYRNLVAGCLEAVWVGSRRSGATVRFLDAAEAGPVFAEYELAHSKTAIKLMKTMGVSYDGTDAGRVEMMRQIPMVEFTVT